MVEVLKLHYYENEYLAYFNMLARIFSRPLNI